jgi:hypothetical protein
MTTSGQPLVLHRGMRIRRQGSNDYCSVGPFFKGKTKVYCFTVQHGMNRIVGNRVVEATFGGFDYVPIGTYVTGSQDADADWAIVELSDRVTIDPTIPKDEVAAKFKSAPKVPKVIAVGYSYQQGGVVMFESTTGRRGDLNGRVKKSPTYRDQHICEITGTGRVIEGYSGMPVYNHESELVGIQWAVERDGARHLFYVQPIEVVTAKLVIKLTQLIKADQITEEWQLAEPLAELLFGDNERLPDDPGMFPFMMTRFC